MFDSLGNAGYRRYVDRQGTWEQESFDAENLLLEGRSDTNKLVRINAGRNLIGALCDVRITEVKGAQLMGVLVG